MPYSCSVEQGAVVTRPGPERSFEITANREERLFTTCDPPFSNNCRSLTVHKFEIACGLDRVSWGRVVASIGRTTAGDASVSKGHIVLVRDTSQAAGHAPSCSDRKGGSPAGGECLPWRVRKPTERIVLPQGFAPLREVGARFIDGATPPAYAAADVMALSRQSLPGSGPYRMTPDAGSGEAFETLQPVATTGSTLIEPEHGDGWTTSLSFKPPEDAPPELIVASLSEKTSPAPAAAQTVPAMPVLPWIAVLGCLGLAAAFYVYRTQQLRFATPNLADAAAGARRNLQRLQDRAEDTLRDLQQRLTVSSEDETAQPVGSSDPALSSALLQLKAMLARTEAAVAMLSTAAVVREVMQSELAAIRVRIDEAERASRRGSTPVMKLAAQFRQIARDIDRVQNITQSASQSFSMHAQSMSVPTTVEQAYALIGVDREDGPVMAKRVIDSLRKSSHPDHAQNEADRLDREARIQQINVASDLIMGRRHPS